MSRPYQSSIDQRWWGIYNPSRIDTRRVILVPGAVVGLCLLSVAMGWLISTDHLLIALLLCIALPIAFVVAWAGSAAIAGVILMLTLNGVPGLNVSSFNVHGSFEAIDICAVGLIVLAAARYFFGGREPVDRRTRHLAAWSIAFLIVWTIALVKGVDRSVPTLNAALYGRDFLFFALLAPLAKALFKSERDLTRFVVVVGVMTTVYALGEIATSLGALSPSIINVKQTLAVGSLTRVYSSMNDLVALGFACALAYALLNTGKRATWATMVAVICGVAVILQLTRALYLGLVVGMIFAFIVWATGRSQLRSLLRRRLLWTAVGMIVFGTAMVFVAPQVFSSSSIQTITNRVTQGISDIGSSTGVKTTNTVAYRQHVSSLMLQVLGSHWVLGLGFLHTSSTVFFPQLPNGSIRNNDVGVLNILMTMGIIGTILIYVPVLMAVGCALPRQSSGTRWDWLLFGGMIWIISVIAGSLSLVTLFSPNGLVLTAVMLGIMFRLTRWRDRQVSHSSTAARVAE